MSLRLVTTRVNHKSGILRPSKPWWMDGDHGALTYIAGVKRLQLMETCREMVTDLLGRRVDGRLVVEGRNGFGPLPGQLSVTGHGRCGPKPSVAERSGCFGRCGQKEPGHAEPGGAAAQQLHGLAWHTTAHFYTLITQITKLNHLSVASKSVYLAIQQSEFVRAQRHVSGTITSLDVKNPFLLGFIWRNLVISQSAVRGGGAFGSSRPQQQLKANESRRSKDNETDRQNRV